MVNQKSNGNGIQQKVFRTPKTVLTVTFLLWGNGARVKQVVTDTDPHKTHTLLATDEEFADREKAAEVYAQLNAL